MTPRLILASQSAARAQLLAAAGYPFVQIPSGAIEPPRRVGQPFTDWLRDLAESKARAVAAQHPGAWILGADTALLLGDEVIGKPADRAGAHAMLRRLSGRTHQLSTAVCLIVPGSPPRIEMGVDTAYVTLRNLTAHDIERYVEAVNPVTCAGAYALQGGGGTILKHVYGDPTTIIGLPMDLVADLLRRSRY